jgi:hypothetical protein
LPPAKGAASLFREALNKLLDDVTFLEREYENESSRRFSNEYLQDRRFFQYTREEVAWAVPSLGRTRSTAAGRSPGNGLTQLIAVYLLAFGDPEPLIEKLHHDPENLDREQLRKHIKGHRSPKGRKPGLWFFVGKYTMADTISDLLVDSCGALVAAFVALALRRRGDRLT